MKNRILQFSVLGIFFFIYSCSKQDNEQPGITPPVSYPNYSQLKVGNYWIYQRFEIDSSGNATALNQFDSCYVEKDTLINRRLYYKLNKPKMFIAEPTLYLRDSLHYLVNSEGKILFSSQDFSTVFSSEYLIVHMDDTVCHIESKMTDRNMTVSTPAGNFVTSNFRETYNMYPRYSRAGSVRYRHARYANGVGLVTETLHFFVSNPNQTERRLVRYKVN